MNKYSTIVITETPTLRYTLENALSIQHVCMATSGFIRKNGGGSTEHQAQIHRIKNAAKNAFHVVIVTSDASDRSCYIAWEICELVGCNIPHVIVHDLSREGILKLLNVSDINHELWPLNIEAVRRFRDKKEKTVAFRERFRTAMGNKHHLLDYWQVKTLENLANKTGKCDAPNMWNVVAYFTNISLPFLLTETICNTDVWGGCKNIVNAICENQNANIISVSEPEQVNTLPPTPYTLLQVAEHMELCRRVTVRTTTDIVRVLRNLGYITDSPPSSLYLQDVIRYNKENYGEKYGIVGENKWEMGMLRPTIFEELRLQKKDKMFIPEIIDENLVKYLYNELFRGVCRYLMPASMTRNITATVTNNGYTFKHLCSTLTVPGWRKCDADVTTIDGNYSAFLYLSNVISSIPVECSQISAHDVQDSGVSTVTEAHIIKSLEDVPEDLYARVVGDLITQKCVVSLQKPIYTNTLHIWPEKKSEPQCKRIMSSPGYHITTVGMNIVSKIEKYNRNNQNIFQNAESSNGVSSVSILETSKPRVAMLYPPSSA